MMQLDLNQSFILEKNSGITESNLEMEQSVPGSLVALHEDEWIIQHIEEKSGCNYQEFQGENSCSSVF